MTPNPRIEVRSVAPGELAEPLTLLGESLRSGEPVAPLFVEQLERAVERGDLEMLVARTEQGARAVGAAVLAFRLNVSAGSSFASIEDLYVGTDVRRWGIGRTLLEAVEERCRVRGVSYVEVQTDEEAEPFYAALGYELEPGVRVLSRSITL